MKTIIMFLPSNYLSFRFFREKKYIIIEIFALLNLELLICFIAKIKDIFQIWVRKAFENSINTNLLFFHIKITKKK